MNKVIKLSLKNLTRQKRRNVVLAIAIAFGFFVVTALEGLTTGMVSNLENMAMQMTGGSVLIGGYEKIPAEMPGQKDKLVGIVKDRDYMKNLVESNNIDYEYYSCFTLSGGSMIFNGKKSMTSLYGRDFKDENFIDSFQFVDGGVENLSIPNAFIISDKTADAMNLKVGDQILFSMYTVYGQQNVMDLTVAAIYKSNSIMNTMQSYTDIETLNKAVGIPEGGYTTFTIYLKNKKQQDMVANKLEAAIRADGMNVSSRAQAMKQYPSNVGKGIDKQFRDDEYQWDGVKYGVETLNDSLPQIKTVLGIVHTVTTIILLVILLIVMVGVSNTYKMVLYERIREIGTMRALGMSGKDTGRVFTWEAVILCIIGALGGVILACAGMAIVSLFPIHNESLAFFLDKGHFTFKVSLGSILIKYILLIILTTLAVRSSAKKAARMSPAEALRTVK